MIIFLLYIFLILVIFTPKYVIASEIEKNCDNRYLTLVNPVRGRDLWIDRRVDPLKNQYSLIKQHNFSATWLLQYDALVDEELLDEINRFDSSQEKGIFLEVSQNFAEQSRVIYPHAVPWFSPQAVFLSGYSQSDRRKLIDKLFKEFKQKFGYYPKSVGAWWIDSYSLNYMKDKYDIKAAMIVADQKTTDNYGVWGQWWGVPYYPAKANILTPASNLNNKQDVVVIQWAQRDPDLAYGEGTKYSNYSLQANDYTERGKDTTYFNELVNVYLDCKNKLGQATVGLETGIESVGYINEYGDQLEYLSTIPNLNIVTMSQFSDRFSDLFPQFPKEFQVDSNWILKTGSRNNYKLEDNIKYQQDIAFKDFFVPDKQDFLDRNLRGLTKDKLLYFPWFLPVIFVLGLFSLLKKRFSIWVVGTLFAVLSFGLILRSNYQFGWQIFYGPAVSYLIFAQIIIILVSYPIVWLLSRVRFIRNNHLILWFIPLSYGIDFIIQSIRFSQFSGRYYFGVALDNLRFFGFSFASSFNLEFVNKDFSSVISSSLLRFDYAKVWDNLYLALLIYPLVHILLGIILGLLTIRLSNKIRKYVIIIIIILTGLFFINIFQSDPRLVQ